MNIDVFKLIALLNGGKTVITDNELSSMALEAVLSQPHRQISDMQINVCSHGDGTKTVTVVNGRGHVYARYKSVASAKKYIARAKGLK